MKNLTYRKLMRGFSLLLAAVMICGAFVGCSGTSSKPAPAATPGASVSTSAATSASASTAAATTAKPDKVFELKWGHVAAATFPYHLAAEKVAKEVLASTNGAVKITVFPSSQLGTQREMTEGLKTGAMDITNTSTSVLSGYIPRIQIVDLPFLFRNREHAYAVLDGPVGTEIFAGADQAAGLIVAQWENGVRDLFNSKRAIKSPADMKGMKIRTMESKAYIRMAECLGANATPMAYGEVYTSLQQKTVDGADSPIPGVYADKFYEVAKYITLSEHAYSPSPVMVSPLLEKKIGSANYAIVIKAIKDNTKWERDYSKSDEADKIALLKKQGVDVYTPTEAEKQQFIDACKPVWTEFAPIVGQALIDKVVAVK